VGRLKPDPVIWDVVDGQFRLRPPDGGGLPRRAVAWPVFVLPGSGPSALSLVVARGIACIIAHGRGRIAGPRTAGSPVPG
jgi:hypothetical protein